MSFYRKEADMSFLIGISAGILIGVVFMSFVCSKQLYKKEEEIYRLKKYICNKCTNINENYCNNCQYNYLKDAWNEVFE